MSQRIPQTVIDDIRQQVDLVDIAGQYTNLDKRGKNYVGLCPFHDENTPSFTVEPKNQFYKCFSCGRGGNVFSFIMAIEDCSFPAAVEKVAELGNVSVDFDFSKAQASGPALDETSKQLIQVHETAASFYHYILTATKPGEAALAYLNGRGLKEETIERFQIGLAPKEKGVLHRYLLGKGLAEGALKQSGIFVGEAGDIDRFNDRIIFPLRDEQGRVRGFSGRVFRSDAPEDAPKYLNSPETAIFTKSRFLFNLNHAKEQKRELILFEGFMDVIKADSVGVTNGVASLGTSLTDDQIRLIQRRAKAVTIAYDGDRPGFAATKRAVEHFHQLTPHQPLKILLFPEGLDPDEFVERHGSEAFTEFVNEQTLSVMAFYRLYYRQVYDLGSDDGRVQYIRAMLEKIAERQSEIEREVQLKTLSEDTGVKQTTLAAQLEVIGARQTTRSNERPIAPPVETTEQRIMTPLQHAEAQLLNRLVNQPCTWALLPDGFAFQSETFETLYLLLEDWHAEYPDAPIPPGDFYSILHSSDEQEAFLQAVQLSVPAQCEAREVNDLIWHIVKKPELENKLRDIAAAMRDAATVSDHEQFQQLTAERMAVLKALKRT